MNGMNVLIFSSEMLVVMHFCVQIHDRKLIRKFVS